MIIIQCTFYVQISTSSDSIAMKLIVLNSFRFLNITQLLANLLTKPSVFYYLPIVSCNLVSLLYMFIELEILTFFSANSKIICQFQLTN